MRRAGRLRGVGLSAVRWDPNPNPNPNPNPTPNPNPNPNQVRWDPEVGGVAALLAVEGANTARLLAAHAATDGGTTPAAATDGGAMTTPAAATDGAATGEAGATEEAGASARLTLALGESPLAVRPAAARAAWREDGWEGVEGVAWCGALETLFGVLHER